MRPDRIVMAPPAFDDDLSFSEGIEDLAVEQLIAQARVEALDVAVLPRTAALDPSLDGLGDETQAHYQTGDCPRWRTEGRRTSSSAGAWELTASSRHIMVWKVFLSTRDRATSLDAILSVLRERT